MAWGAAQAICSKARHLAIQRGQVACRVRPGQTAGHRQDHRAGVVMLCRIAMALPVVMWRFGVMGLGMIVVHPGLGHVRPMQQCLGHRGNSQNA